jgi:gluconate 2-dehydrogenase subunit 3-like protein
MPAHTQTNLIALRIPRELRVTLELTWSALSQPATVLSDPFSITQHFAGKVSRRKPRQSVVDLPSNRACHCDAAQGKGPVVHTKAIDFCDLGLNNCVIIPPDERSPGAKATGVPGFIDLMVSESPSEVKTLGRDGLAAIERISQKNFSAAFNSAGIERQVSLLKAISKNERKPKRIEERFFVAIKSLTVDGYYTSQIGIHQELQYKGNAYLKEFVGCTHPEHSS